MNSSFKIRAIPGVLIGFFIFTLPVNVAHADFYSVSVSPSTPYLDYQVHTGGSTYQIDVEANGGDPVVQLYSGTSAGAYDFYDVPLGGYFLAVNDDNIGLSSQLIGSLDRGNYVIRVSSFGYWFASSSETRTYTLTFSGLASGQMPTNMVNRKLSFSQSTKGSDLLSDPDGELRKLVDKIMKKK